MFASRTDPDAMHVVAGHIEMVQKGLFSHIHAFQLRRTNKAKDEATFRRSRDVVFEALGIDSSAITDIHERGVVKSYVQQRMTNYTEQTGYIFKPDSNL